MRPGRHRVEWRHKLVESLWLRSTLKSHHPRHHESAEVALCGNALRMDLETLKAKATMSEPTEDRNTQNRGDRNFRAVH